MNVLMTTPMDNNLPIKVPIFAFITPGIALTFGNGPDFSNKTSDQLGQLPLVSRPRKFKA